MKEKRILGNSLLMLTAIIWGTAFVFQRVGMESIEPITFNAARMALSAVMIGLVSLFTSRIAKKKSADKSAEEQKRFKKDTIIGGICCGIFLSLGSIFQQMGLVYTSAGKAGFITAMYILLVPVIGVIFLKKKNNWIVWLSVLLGVAGMYLLCISGEFKLSHGDTLVCLCALFFSGHILCCDHFARKGDPIVISAIQFTTVTIISSVFAFITEEPTVDKLISAVIPIVYCGIMSGGVGYTLQLVGQKYTNPTTASLLMSMESVFAVITGVVFLKEYMNIRELIGCIIMFVAIILVQIPVPKKEK